MRSIRSKLWRLQVTVAQPPAATTTARGGVFPPILAGIECNELGKCFWVEEKQGRPRMTAGDHQSRRFLGLKTLKPSPSHAIFAPLKSDSGVGVEEKVVELVETKPGIYYSQNIAGKVAGPPPDHRRPPKTGRISLISLSSFSL